MSDIDTSGYASRYFKEFIDAVKASVIDLERRIGKLEASNEDLKKRLDNLKA
ncbi:MAG TPA: hypothetical protein VGQ55_03370 [Pyrinomonadaceae bacterium]|jgi:cell division septum initiation protein DivIVA|nr:hypothetical protein [Pyrinomonadaceae bacterium]